MKEEQKGKVPEEFTYEFFENNRYKISQKDKLEAICNNGFIKLYTLNTRVYWHAQNQFQHRIPDWKFHISVRHEDLKRAWNLLVGLFIKLHCRAGMKVIYLREVSSPTKGREITLYIVKIDEKLNESSFAGEFNVSLADEHSEEFWLNFVLQIQALLDENQIKSNGLADGDLAIGKYVSLRNEAFVLSDTGNYIYPPNQKGWNPLHQKIPINVQKFKKMLTKETNNSWLFRFSLPFLILTFSLWISHTR